jgi:hypothetical protein
MLNRVVGGHQRIGVGKNAFVVFVAAAVVAVDVVVASAFVASAVERVVLVADCIAVADVVEVVF